MRRQTLCIPLIPLVLFLCLSGCQGSVQENNLALALRADFLAMDGCSGTMDVTADYGERVYAYTVSFSSTQETGMTMVITAPQEVAGITATIAEGQTYLAFDGVQLETGPLNEEGLSPLMHCLRFSLPCSLDTWRKPAANFWARRKPSASAAGSQSGNLVKESRRSCGSTKPPKTYCKGSSAAREPPLFAVYFLPLL